MARRKFLPVTRIPLVGGRLCLDFVNTTGSRDRGLPRERLNTFRDLLVWAARAGILRPREKAALLGRGAREPDAARRVLDRTREVREILYRALRAVLERRAPAEPDIRHLNRMLAAAARRRELEVKGGRLRWRRPDRSANLDSPLWPIVESAIELLTSTELSRTRKCDECDWLFLDSTRNGSRQWCKKECGDRVRARRYYRRRLDSADRHDRGGVR